METSVSNTFKKSILYHLSVAAIIISLFMIFRDWLPLAGPAATFAGMLIICGLLAILSRLEGDTFYKKIFSIPESWKRIWTGALWKSLAIFLLSLMVFLPLISWLIGSIPDYRQFDILEGNLGYFLIQMVIVWTIVAFGEEIIFRGFLMIRLRAVFGDSRLGQVLNVVIAATVFGYLHAYQGMPGQILTGLVGMLFCVNYIREKYNLWQNVLMHGIIDTIATSIFYFGWHRLIL